MVGLSVSSAVVDLTPDHAADLGGFAIGPRKSTEVHSRLEANIVAFSDGERIVVLASLDLLFVGRELRIAIESAAKEAFGVEPDQVITLASHTHYAPMLDRLKPRLGDLDETALGHWCSALTSAFAGMSRPTGCNAVRRGTGESFAATNRRLRWPWPTAARVLGRKRGDVYMADNPDGPADRSIRVWAWTSAGRPLAVLWAFACHPTGFPGRNTVSAEFPGVVRQALREAFGADLAVLYAPTCMGDVRPRTGARGTGVRQALDLALYGPRPRPFSRPEWEAWSGSLAREVLAAIADKADEPIGSARIGSTEVAIPIARLVEGRCPTEDMICKGVSLPGLGRIVTLSCEPVSEVAPLIGAGADLVAGYEGDVFGYLPVDRMIAEGGYEAGGYFPAFGMTGKLKPGIDKLLRETGERLAAGLASGHQGSR
ncbi:hypothetical protein [Brevundimonas sp.]|uniref:hypothetical protein n=1 Tax=Brevundimonas sp. TaxID=1871086 RepID=UPI002D36BCA6|nr:hypothetical protein [Brevundimonas sp.]HYC67399.1 hypothetical protein [Brevundimonas sp.]